MAANLRYGSKGLSRYVVTRDDYGPFSIGVLKGSRIFFSELNLELIIDENLARL